MFLYNLLETANSAFYNRQSYRMPQHFIFTLFLIYYKQCNLWQDHICSCVFLVGLCRPEQYVWLLMNMCHMLIYLYKFTSFIYVVYDPLITCHFGKIKNCIGAPLWFYEKNKIFESLPLSLSRGEGIILLYFLFNSSMEIGQVG